MSTDMYSESRRVCPSIHGNKFDTANRKRAVANIFEKVNQDALMRLFQKTGDMKAEERVRSIFSFTHDPEETAKALMALKQRKKDKMTESLVIDTSPLIQDMKLGTHSIWSCGGAQCEGIPRLAHAETLMHHNMKTLENVSRELYAF
uniref:Transcriptional and immune response regulator a n=1 Tax=Cyprinus carpio TaxID=7962 RepID=A0A8C2B4P9_CYPCA